VAKVSSTTELRNLTDQIYELSKIVKAKMEAISSIRTPLLWMTISWLAGTITVYCPPLKLDTLIR
jgi:hypothetical protein